MSLTTPVDRWCLHRRTNLDDLGSRLAPSHPTLTILLLLTIAVAQSPRPASPALATFISVTMCEVVGGPKVKRWQVLSGGFLVGRQNTHELLGYDVGNETGCCCYCVEPNPFDITAR